MKNRIVLLLLTTLLPVVSHIPLYSNSAAGALFLQVNFSNPLTTITQTKLQSLLNGDAGLPVSLYLHPMIAGAIKERYPRCKGTVASFDDPKIRADLSFLGVSDLRGLRPCFRPVAIDGAFPWGEMGDDYAISKGGVYPLQLKGAELWDEEKHITIVQTGVTAMTRAFIPAVERSGDHGSPIRYVRGITAGADLAVTSNEVSFCEPCTYPLKDRMRFCSPVRFFSLLRDAGFDVIELTGNHNNDFGIQPDLETLAMYEKAGMTCYGGGKNRTEAESVRYVTVKGTVFAFVGFNELGPPEAWATETRPGAARLRREVFERSVREAVARAQVVFVSVQWGNENDPRPQKIQREYSRLAADLGVAVIVSSSAHRAMGLEIYEGKWISYGLGNFLFDQMQTVRHRRGLMARHHFYRGRHVSTELIPYMLYDNSQPRLLKGREATEFLGEVYDISLFH